MDNQIKRTVFLALSLLVFIAGCANKKANPIINYECDFLPMTTKPDWVLGGENLNSNFFSAVGLSSRVSGGPAAQIQQAKLNARSELASIVRSQIIREVASYISVKNNETIYSETTFRANQISEVILHNVTFERLYLDQSSCLVWAKANVNRIATEEMLARQDSEIEKLKHSKKLFLSANQQFKKLEERKAYLAEAITLLEKTNFLYIPTNYSNAESTLKKYLALEEKLELQGKKEISIKQFKKAMNYFEHARHEKNSKTERLENLSRSRAIIESIDFKYLSVKQSKRQYITDINKLQEYISDDVLRLINVGTSLERAVSLLGPPERVVSAFMWKTTTGVNYNKYWLLSRNGNIECIVLSAGIGFDGAIGSYMRSCKWHSRNRARYIIKI